MGKNENPMTGNFSILTFFIVIEIGITGENLEMISLKRGLIQMKNLVLIIFVLLCSMCTVEKVSAHSFSSAAEDAAVVVNQPELSIKQAIELAYPSAQKWNKNAQLLQAINIDLDLPGNSDGSNGKRKFWNISFGIPDTNKFFLVTIHEGKIDKAQELTEKGILLNRKMSL